MYSKNFAKRYPLSDFDPYQKYRVQLVGSDLLFDV
jgi:hypothetical protein